MTHHDDSLDAAIRNRSRATGQPAVDALNAAVPQSDPARRDALEQRLLARLTDDATSERKPTMNYTSALRGQSYAPQRLRISTSLLLTVAVAVLCAAAVFFARLNPQPPEEDRLPVGANVNDDQDQAAVTATETPTPFEPTATPASLDNPTQPPQDTQVTATSTPFGSDGTGGETFGPPTIVPTSTPFGQELPTATPIGAGTNPSNAIYYTVQEGDTLESIAALGETSVADIIELNDLDPNVALVVGQQLLVGFTEIQPTSIPQVLPSPTMAPLLPTVVPPDVPWMQPTYPAAFSDRVAPPSAWLPGDAHVSALGSTGMMVGIPHSRLMPTAMNPAFVPGETGRVNLFTVVGVSPWETIGALHEGEDLTLAWVPVASSAQVMQVNEAGDVIVWLSLEQGIVLNWLLTDTRVPIVFERTE